MECKACKREEARRKRPEWFDNSKHLLHTCNQPERSKREDSLPRPLSNPSFPDGVKLTGEEGMEAYGKYIKVK